MKQIIEKVFIFGLPLVILWLFFSLTNPNDLSLPLFLVPILLIFITTYIYGLGVIKKLTPRNRYRLTPKILATVLALGLTGLVVLQSINQLTLVDFGLLGLFTLLLTAYIKRMSRAS